MDRRAINVDNVTISYLEKNKDASLTLFFFHGNSCSANFWRKQVNSPLFSDYRLVVFDLPGHGESGVPQDSKCSLIGLAQIMSEAVRQLSNNGQYILIGASLATNIVAEMLWRDMDPRGIILAGPCIIGDNYQIQNMLKENTHADVVFKMDVDDEELYQYAIETSISRSQEDINLFIEDFRKTNKTFRFLLAESLAKKVYNDQIDVFKGIKNPILIVFGADEKILHPHYLDDAKLPLWNEVIYKIKGASHLVPIDEPEIFNSLAHNYISSLNNLIAD